MKAHDIESQTNPEPTRPTEGRDEMNLAEFPLGVLSDRTLPGQKTLVFEDRLHDAGRNEWITRRLTISASEKYGLPTALDDEVILGLIQLTKEQEFAERRVPFTRNHLREILGWRDEGRSYQRLETSLRRWLGVTLYYDKAWWDKATNTWVDENFHILEQVTIRRRARANQGTDAEAVRSSFVWNEVVFRSFQAGYLKRLNWEAFRSLTLPTAKRMYRFLDKRFYHKDLWEFDLHEFAFEHIGLSRSYDTGQVKRKLLPGLTELEGVRFIEPLTPKERFVRVNRGNWRIVVKRRTDEEVAQMPVKELMPAAKELLARGVSDPVASALCKSHGEEVVLRQVAAFDRLVKAGQDRALRNPAGFLVSAIRKGFKLDRDSHVVPSKAILPKQVVTPVTKRVVETQQEADFREFWEKLAADEQAAMEAEALQSSRGLLRDRYEDAVARGQETLRQLYRDAILMTHYRGARHLATSA